MDRTRRRTDSVPDFGRGGAQALGNAGALLQAIFDHAQVGIALIRDRIVEDCNDTFATMFGYQRSELIGQSTRQIHASADTWEDVGRALYPLIGSGQTYVRFGDASHDSREVPQCPARFVGSNVGSRAFRCTI